MSVELIVTGNGPGELAGWIAPVARAARAQAGADLRLTLALTPSQFATGREAEVVRGWGIFDRVLKPAAVIAHALGIGDFPRAAHAAVLHLGGDPWLSARLARRLRVPACALAETTLIARRHRGFARIFAVTDGLADLLHQLGVPDEKTEVTGDPRADALADAVTVPPRARPAGGWLVSFLPGSRDRVFLELAPYYLHLAAAIARDLPETAFQVITSPFLAPETVERVRRLRTAQAPASPVSWIGTDPWPDLAASDLVVTIPGTNTLELAMLGVPFAVVLDTRWVGLAPLEGLAEWVARLPGLGRPLRGLALTRHLRGRGFLALPNLQAGRAMVPEWIGRWKPEELAKRVTGLLRDPERRRAMAQSLRERYAPHGGPARAIAGEAMRLAAEG